MTTIQEYLNQDKNTDHIYIEGNWYHSNLDGGELDLSDFPNVKKVNINGINLRPPLTKINLKKLTNLEELHLWYTGINSLDFLNELPNPEKLKVLSIPSNNFAKSDLVIFERFKNLSELNISNLSHHDQKNGIYNRFEGKLTPFLKSLSKLDYSNTLVFNSPELETRAETQEQELNRLRIENQRLKNHNAFLLEQLELTAQIEQPPK